MMSILLAEIKTKKQTDDYGEFEISPLERGFGHTIGNSLRRVLLSSLWGAAITSVRIKGVAHEFSTIKGVKEDVVDLVLNLKKINFRMDVKRPLVVTVQAQGPKEVTAGDLKCPTGIKVLNPDLHLASLADKKTKLEMELTVEYGRGYQLEEKEQAKVGVILLDADFSPTLNVSCKVSPTRVGKRADLDKLEIKITTDGSISPKEALQKAAAILTEQFEVFKGKEVVERIEEGPKEKKTKERKVDLEELDLPTRLLNSLKKGGVKTVADVRKKGKEGLEKIRNVGPKSSKLLFDRIEKENL